jgi:eukaryotic-like serine/threonine-protein kinase
MRMPGFSNKFKAVDATPAPNSGRFAAPPPVDALIGHKALGRYELIRLIGEGSNGEVYLARVIKRPAEFVVVKRVKSHLLQNPAFRKFFDAEVKSMLRFQHPYSVRLFEATLDEPVLGPCLVLEYVHGVTLEAVLNHYRRLSPEQIARLLGQFCHALQAAHDAGIMHRDLKPANVMVCDFGTPNEILKVMDFGFAGFTEKPHIQLAELTGEGPNFACGTPAYVSPEMVRADTVDARADLYGVGVMLYELLTGHLPFELSTVEEILAAHVERKPPPFRSLGITDVPPGVEAVVMIALSKYPNERHASPMQLAKHFGQAVGMDIWMSTAPPGYAPPNARAPRVGTMSDNGLQHTPRAGSIESRFTLSDQFEALLPPRMAAAKIRGFCDDVGGQVLESEPGIVRMRVGVPDGYKDPGDRSGLRNLLSAIRKPSVRSGREPIEMNLQMRRVDLNRVAVRVVFYPLEEFVPTDHATWTDRCENLNNALRMYLMASG